MLQVINIKYNPKVVGGMNRRTFLATSGTGLLTAVAGCGEIVRQVPFVGPDIPPFVAGWAEVRDDGTAPFVLHFDGDIQAEIERYDVSGEDLLDNEGSKIAIRLRPVDVDIPDEVPPEETVEGLLENFALRIDSWPAAPWYSTGRVWLEDDIDIVQGANIAIRFPSGYTHHVPATKTVTDLDFRTYDGVYNYSGHPRIRTIPAITHYDYPPFISLRIGAEYRFDTAKRLASVYSLDRYQGSNLEDVVAGIRTVLVELAERTLEGIVTMPLNEAARAVIDINSLHGSVTEDFEELHDALDSFNDISAALINSSWTNGVHQTLMMLGANSDQAIRRNIAVVTAYQEQGFDYHLATYRDLLQDGLDQAQKGQENLRTGAGPSSGEYWQSLYDLAGRVLQRFAEMYQVELETLEDLASEFRTSSGSA